MNSMETDMQNDQNTETSISEAVGLNCLECDGRLNGRKTRFCSEACRMRNRRSANLHETERLLQQLKGVIEQLELHLAGGDNP